MGGGDCEGEEVADESEEDEMYSLRFALLGWCTVIGMVVAEISGFGLLVG